MADAEKLNSLTLIAGPCSAETEEQTLTTARALASGGIHIFRAGLWKPRTRPGCFEGVGARGLSWLKRIKREFGMKVATEVATPAHVRAAIRADIDILWIGARTTANPFAVQDIADTIHEEQSFSGRDTTVLVKNPVSPDLELWIGALQRLSNAGIKKLGTVHRGFGTYGNNRYRNPPHWQIPIELKRRFPELPILFDPSHTGGKASLVAPLSQQALDMGFSGLMIESHITPEVAWSDKDQQITPAELLEIIRTLRIPEREIKTGELEALRAEIDVIDSELIELLAKRMDVSERIGEYKRQNGLPAVQIERHDEIMRDRLAAAKAIGLDSDFIQSMLSAIHAESVQRQLAVMRPSKK